MIYDFFEISKYLDTGTRNEGRDRGHTKCIPSFFVTNWVSAAKLEFCPSFRPSVLPVSGFLPVVRLSLHIATKLYQRRLCY